MNIRPATTTWFELLTTHDDLADALEALAHTGSIELELHDHSRMQMDLQDLQSRLHEYTKLERIYRTIWPGPDTGLSPFSGSSAAILDTTLARVYAWEREAQPVIQGLEVVKRRIADLHLLHEFLHSAETADLDYSLLSTASPVISARLFLLPSKSRLEHIPEQVLWKEYATPTQNFLLLVGTVDALDGLSTELASKKNTYVRIPPLPADRKDAVGMLEESKAKLELQLQQMQNKLDHLADKHQLSQALGELHKMSWFLQNVSALPVSSNFSWITGWTSDQGGDRLRKALLLQGSRAILRFPDAPQDAHPPLILHNPWWAKPFEMFANLLGMPDRDEADPSRVLALLAPLLFGYMFGDVGQGFILLMAGIVLKDRWPLLRILVANGASAMAFGLVFGSVFGREDLISPLWLHPIDDPLAVLAVPLLAAVFIMLTGLLLKAMESRWRGDWIRWMHIEAPVIGVYLGIVSAFLLQGGYSLYLILSSLIWFLVGSLLLSNGKLRTVLTAVGALFEAILQLILNTVSFVRVGAFALAHAGLSTAFNIMADSTESLLLSLLVLLLGNGIVILLEGLVVSIQTTRLILFEFFVRFLQANGRVFKPLAGPAPVGAE